ncbi:MAG: hypothetical protein JWN62_1260 [Acidimicrobiales bacterium]|nr:hypothetical protein [Acidimicrobiales bacterium]
MAPLLGLVAVVALAACGSAAAKQGDDVASLGSAAASDSGPTDSSTPTSVDAQQAFTEYAQCMRDHGVDMPDPQVAQEGSTGGGGPILETAAAAGEDTPGSGPLIDPNGDDFKTADAACQSIIAAVTNDIKIDPKVEAEHRQQALDFAKCMRDHGIDFPDPVFGDNGMVTQSLGGPDSDGPDPNSDEFESAQSACITATGMPQPTAGGGASTGGGPFVVDGNTPTVNT